MADAPLRTLLVDDTDLNSLQMVLGSESIEVVATATDGESALAEAEKTDFDVAVVDYKMPGMNGVEVAQRLKEIRPGCEVIILTNYDVRDEVAASDAVDHFHEKIAIESLGEILMAIRARRLGAAAPAGFGDQGKKGLFRRKK
jgi:DNA-binding NarL/FixJ family response regulator